MFLAGYRHIQGFQGDTAGERTQNFLSLIIVYKSVVTDYCCPVKNELRDWRIINTVFYSNFY